MVNKRISNKNIRTSIIISNLKITLQKLVLFDKGIKIAILLFLQYSVVIRHLPRIC